METSPERDPYAKEALALILAAEIHDARAAFADPTKPYTYLGAIGSGGVVIPGRETPEGQRYVRIGASAILGPIYPEIFGEAGFPEEAKEKGFWSVIHSDENAEGRGSDTRHIFAYWDGQQWIARGKKAGVDQQDVELASTWEPVKVTDADLAAIQATLDGTHLVYRVADVFEGRKDMETSLAAVGVENPDGLGEIFLGAQGLRDYYRPAALSAIPEAFTMVADSGPEPRLPPTPGGY